MNFFASVLPRINAACRRLTLNDTRMREERAEFDTLGWYRAAHSDMRNSATVNKKYSPPQLRKLNPEQAKLILIGHAMAGDDGAKELMGVIFPEPGKRIDSHSRKRNS